MFCLGFSSVETSAIELKLLLNVQNTAAAIDYLISQLVVDYLVD